MKLTEKQLRHLRGLGHQRKVVVIIGNSGLSETVMAEIESSLAHHELLKVRVNAEERSDRDAMISAICTALDAVLVQRVGHVALLYRPAEPPRLSLTP
ncbi:MAG: YhbY family RNA-binding protein [Gammaproteobacteria bacterium]|nr:YhbY family RNA-binding protein [Gammaproteobacteria bacterium]